MPRHGDEPDPQILAGLFGSGAETARRYAEHLATTGVGHGLIGPREVDRLWSRHLVNCALIAPSLPTDAVVADVGSGAGLPGLVLAIARPDVHVHLIEPLERRTRWLGATAADLGLDVEIHQAKAESVWDRLSVDVATSRAVASLGELARMSLPLVRPGGRMIAIKGDRAANEVATDADLLARLGAGQVRVVTYPSPTDEASTVAVELSVVSPAPHWREPVGDGPARTAARKKDKRKQRAANRRHQQGR